ncbi:N-acetylmuramic acid 6-phosphate etherase [Spiroplasma clarkii]|uniref:N-acetylmuramic acid 6-phosphate etherase n=1 Tax=Spiroplasma clarkii TaxID=2139 RepID=A0A2K8KHP3_9MOLU|nr:N-acetylmuramic acid 6-phosphate etherase [Spiroplasma clarkii]ATX71208.1 N-acetylmuramic acid 6-phosphate etherase [Spiroplasma clarkii]
MKLENIDTEKRNSKSMQIDKASTIEILKIINSEDQKVAIAINEQLSKLASIIDKMFNKVKTSGRIFYVGAGTSGRIGILDASEILPTYGDNSTFIGIIAGGDEAIKTPIEGAEDDIAGFARDIKKFNLNSNDCIVGIGASGRTPYVIGALKYAAKVGVLPVALCMSKNNEFANYCEDVICIDTGAEVVTGSTRMKAGTATKLVCNMISTTIMIKKGKVFENLMIDVKATNKKLQQRCINIVKELTGKTNDNEIEDYLQKYDWNIKTVVSHLKD